MFAKVKPNTQIIGQNIIYFNQVNSTNKFALELIRQNLADNGTVVLAEYQTEGKGQFDREWQSEAFENLMFSIILKHVTNPPPNPFIINKSVTLSMCQCISQLLPDRSVKIKWPNDIFVNNKKISGILVENNFSGNTLNYSIIGIGLNVNQDYSLYENLRATSLRIESCSIMDRSNILTHILEKIETNLLNIASDKNPIERLFDENLLGYHKECEFDINNKKEIASILSCDKDGRLVLKLEKENKAYLHGEIKQIINV